MFKNNDEKKPAGKKAAWSKEIHASLGKLIVGGVIVAVAASGITAIAARGGSVSGKAVGKYVLSDADLSTVVARYSYDGKTHDVTANEVLVANGGAVANTDGTYSLPSAEEIVAYIRQEILSSELDKQGISVSDDEADAYAEEAFGSSDYASLASSYNVSEDFIRSYIKTQARTQKAYQQISGESDQTAPDMPTMQDGDDDSTVRPEYAAYIIALAGDEWDSAAGTWKDSDGAYASALASYDVTADGASYAAAKAAYDVAYQDYVNAVSSGQAKWTEFTGNIYSNTSFSVYCINA